MGVGNAVCVCGCWKGRGVLLRCGRGEEERVLLLREVVGVERGKEVLLLSEGAGVLGVGRGRGRGGGEGVLLLPARPITMTVIFPVLEGNDMASRLVPVAGT